MGARKSSVTSKPITSPEEFERLKEERRERNRMNRQRSKAMERRIAKFLGGDRTPQSGAGTTKGDVVVLFNNRPGKFLIECKLTELWRYGEPCIAISKAWLRKIHEEAKQTRALFGALIFRYHGRTDDYMLIKAVDMGQIAVINETTEKILRFDNIKTKTAIFPLSKAQTCKESPGVTCVWIDFVLYYLLTVVQFKQILEEA
jgi:hypothetical protein